MTSSSSPRLAAAEVSDDLLERCLRALYHAPADKPSFDLLLDMHGRTEGLKAAIEVAFAAGRESVWEQAETEWSARMKDGRPAFAATFTEGGARRYADEQPDHLAVFTRRVGPWERVD